MGSATVFLAWCTLKQMGCIGAQSILLEMLETINVETIAMHAHPFRGRQFGWPKHVHLKGVVNFLGAHPLFGGAPRKLEGRPDNGAPQLCTALHCNEKEKENFNLKNSYAYTPCERHFFLAS